MSCKLCKDWENPGAPNCDHCEYYRVIAERDAALLQVSDLQMKLNEARNALKVERDAMVHSGQLLGKATRDLEESNRLNSDYRKALENIVNVIGPEPARCRCDGCDAEMREALKVAKDALVEKRKHEHKYSGRQCSECGEYKALEPIEGPGSVDE